MFQVGGRVEPVAYFPLIFSVEGVIDLVMNLLRTPRIPTAEPIEVGCFLAPGKSSSYAISSGSRKPQGEGHGECETVVVRPSSLRAARTVVQVVFSLFLS